MISSRFSIRASTSSGVEDRLRVHCSLSLESLPGQHTILPGQITPTVNQLKGDASHGGKLSGLKGAAMLHDEEPAGPEMLFGPGKKATIGIKSVGTTV
jgi:hypothetical protein